jgi:hypothetical protein
MQLIDVYWTAYVNRLVIRCDCGISFDGPSNYSVQQCPACGRLELWHGVQPKLGDWDYPVMQNAVTCHGQA